MSNQHETPVSAPNGEAADHVGTGRASRVLAKIGALTGVALLAGALGWSLRTALASPTDVLDTAPYTTTEATQGAVGQAIKLNAVASWKPQRSIGNQAEGMVTSIDTVAGSRVAAGAVLYRVNLRPVTVAQGETPAFRAIGLDSRGDDVRQLQQMLAELRMYAGRPDGHAGERTVQAIRTWQRSLKLEPDGVVRLGDVLFVPHLPVSIGYDGITVGQSVSPGTGSVTLLGTAPTFTVSLTESQERLAPTGTMVTLTHGQSTWNAKVEQVTPAGEDSAATATLASTTAEPICREQCATLPVAGQSTVPATVVVVPETSGVVVPAAALTSTPDEETVVVSADGIIHPVTVTASARGSAVVDGVKAGTKLRVPGILPSGAPGDRGEQ